MHDAGPGEKGRKPEQRWPQPQRPSRSGSFIEPGRDEASEPCSGDGRLDDARRRLSGWHAQTTGDLLETCSLHCAPLAPCRNPLDYLLSMHKQCWCADAGTAQTAWLQALNLSQFVQVSPWFDTIRSK